VALLTKDIAQKLKEEQGADIVIPKKYTAIEEEAFSIEWDDTSTERLRSVKIPNSITTIGDSAFSRNHLRSIEIPESVITIGDSAFQKNLLTSVTIPSRVTFIDEESFEDNLLTSIKIGENVTSIGGEAFQGNQLKSISIPASVTHIDHDAFDFDSLKTVSISKNAKLDLSVFPKTAEISRGGETIHKYQLEMPKKYKNKFVDKITNFRTSTDTLEIDADSFGIDSTGKFTSGKIKKQRRRSMPNKTLTSSMTKSKAGFTSTKTVQTRALGTVASLPSLKGRRI